MTEIKGVNIKFNFGTLRIIKEITGLDPLSLNFNNDLVAVVYAIAEAGARTGGSQLKNQEVLDWIDSFEMNDINTLVEAFMKFTNPTGEQASPQ